MVLPAGGFFTLAGWVLLFNWAAQRRERRDRVAEIGTVAREGAR